MAKVVLEPCFLVEYCVVVSMRSPEGDFVISVVVVGYLIGLSCSVHVVFLAGAEAETAAGEVVLLSIGLYFRLG